MIVDLGEIPKQLETKYCNVEENLDSSRLTPFYTEIFTKVIEAKNAFNVRRLKLLNENSLPVVEKVIERVDALIKEHQGFLDIQNQTINHGLEEMMRTGNRTWKKKMDWREYEKQMRTKGWFSFRQSCDFTSSTLFETR